MSMITSRCNWGATCSKWSWHNWEACSGWSGRNLGAAADIAKEVRTLIHTYVCGAGRTVVRHTALMQRRWELDNTDGCVQAHWQTQQLTCCLFLRCSSCHSSSMSKRLMKSWWMDSYIGVHILKDAARCWYVAASRSLCCWVLWPVTSLQDG